MCQNQAEAFQLNYAEEQQALVKKLLKIVTDTLQNAIYFDNTCVQYFHVFLNYLETFFFHTDEDFKKYF